MHHPAPVAGQFMLLLAHLHVGGSESSLQRDLCCHSGPFSCRGDTLVLQVLPTRGAFSDIRPDSFGILFNVNSRLYGSLC